MNTDRMKMASYLLPDPGGEVVRELIGEIERLQTIVDPLPKCWRLNDVGVLVQDVSVVPEMKVWLRVMSIDSPKSCRVRYVSADSACVVIGRHGEDDWAFCSSLYSTREAAEAAEQKEDPFIAAARCQAKHRAMKAAEAAGGK